MPFWLRRTPKRVLRRAFAVDPRRDRDYLRSMKFTVEYDREDDGRWIAEVREVPGALAYGDTRARAKARAVAVALEALADRLLSNDSARTPREIQIASA